MKQRKRNKKSVTIQDWLDFKPYAKYGRYDMAYLKVAQQVYDLLETIEGVFEGYGLTDKHHIVELSCLVTSYYEDFISEIGLWSALTDYHMEQYEAPFPFYDTSTYDAEYLNPADLSFVCWHYFATAANRFIPPDLDILEGLGNMLYELLEPQIEDVPTTDFYDNYLTVKATDPFEAVYEKLRWLARKSYLWGWSNQTTFEQRALAMLDEQIAKGEQLTKELMADMENDAQVRLHPFGALHPAQWLSRVARTTPEMKAHLAAMATIHSGLFTFVEADSERICLEHIISGVQYWVGKSSFPQPEALQTTEEVFFCPLMRWKDNWQLAGVLSFYEADGEWVDQFKASYELPFEQLPPEQQEQQAALLPAVGHYFEAYFKSPFVVYASQEEAMAQLEAFYQQLPTDLEQADLSVSDTFLEKPPILPEEVEEEDASIGLFFGSKTGIRFINKPMVWLPALQQKEAPKLIDKVQNYVNLTLKADHPELIAYLLSLYGLEKILAPFGDLSAIEGIPEMDFFRRYYNPESFMPSSFFPLWKKEDR